MEGFFFIRRFMTLLVESGYQFFLENLKPRESLNNADLIDL